MATYFVSPTGKDNNPGTESKPWRTVHKAATTAIAGDTVIYEDGTHDLGSGQSAWKSGTSGNYITHRARNRHQAIWEQTSYGSNAIVLKSESYIKFVDLKMQQKTITEIGKFVQLDGCSYIELNGVEIANTSPHCLMIEDGCNDIIVNDCDLHAETSTVGKGRNGILIYGPGANTNITITNNRVYHNPHTGIGNAKNCTSDDGYTVEHNTVYDNDGHGISFHSATNVAVRYNTIYRAGTWPTPNGTNMGVRITEAADVECAFNDIYDCTGPGVLVESNCGTVEVFNNTLENNNSVSYDWGSIGILYREGTQGSITVKNNLIYHTQNDRCSFYAESKAEPSLTMDFNLWYDSSSHERIRRNGTNFDSYSAYSAAHEPNSIFSSDPQFVDQANHDFSLQAGSPAIDAGVEVGYSDSGGVPTIGAHPYEKSEQELPRLLLSLSIADTEGNSLGQFEFEVELQR